MQTVIRFHLATLEDGGQIDDEESLDILSDLDEDIELQLSATKPKPKRKKK